MATTGASSSSTGAPATFWHWSKVIDPLADLWHTLMTQVLGYAKYAAGGCDVGALVTGQLGFFNGDRAWDLSGGRPIPDGLGGDVRAQVVSFEKKFAVHLAAQVLAPDTLGFGLSDSPAGMLAWILERWAKWSDNGGDIETVFASLDAG